MSWKTEPDFNGRANCRELFRSIQYAGPGYAGNGVAIQLGQHYNGSGAQAFGGARKWPHLKLDVSFPVDDYAARDAFAAKLQAFVDRELPGPVKPEESPIMQTVEIR